MQIQQTLSRLDDLLHQCRLDEAETLLTQAVAQAQAEADTDSEKLLRNEQIGFYRDCGKFPAALETAAAARALFEQTGETDTISYATTLLNCANAYRAAGNYEDAFAAYKTVQSLYARLLPPDDGRVASLWNNLALLYQETEQWEQACTCLKQALELVQHDPDPTRTGISAANLAVSLLRLHRTAEALCYLQQAEKILIGKTPSDFHVSAVYAGFGDAYYQLGEYVKAADAYEKALPEIELHFAFIDGEQHVYLKEEDVSTAIRTEAAGMAASAVGANPAVRAFLLELQRDMAKKQDVLMDGRDIGTVVLPDATVKIFLTATPEARATRRWKEYQAKGIDTPYEEVLADVKQRDYQDTHRAAAPLKQADDAVLLDTSELDFEQSLAAMKKIIAEKVNKTIK